MSEKADGCVTPSRGPILPESATPESIAHTIKEVPNMRVLVGQQAPDFEAGAFVEGGFKNIKLSDYLGKWVVLCFYPGDFTFV